MTLIKRLEAGPGSRELSDEVLLRQGFTFDDTHANTAFWYFQSSTGEKFEWYGRPNPTLNTDDALALVPDDRKFWHISSFPNPDGGIIEYEMWMYSNKGDDPIQVYAPTLPLAICAAVLRIDK